MTTLRSNLAIVLLLACSVAARAQSTPVSRKPTDGELFDLITAESKLAMKIAADESSALDACQAGRDWEALRKKINAEIYQLGRLGDKAKRELAK